MDAMTAIRLARPSDEHALRAVELAIWSPDVSPAPPRPPERAFFPVQSGPEHTLVAVIGGEIAGYAMLAPVTDLESNRHVLEIHNFAVAPAHQRHGVGRMLVEAARAQALSQGVRKLTLRVLAPNDRARQFYASCGFVVEGVLSGEFLLGGRYVDDVLMALDLVPHST